MTVEINIINQQEISQFTETIGFNMAVVLLLSGDRISCCDEAAALVVDGETVGVCTIAPQGEMRSGKPTIVGMYIVPGHRGQGHGVRLFEACVRRCIERGFTSVHVDIMSKAMTVTLDRMDQTLRRQHLKEVHHKSGGKYVL